MLVREPVRVTLRHRRGLGRFCVNDVNAESVHPINRIITAALPGIFGTDR